MDSPALEGVQWVDCFHLHPPVPIQSCSTLTGGAVSPHRWWLSYKCSVQLSARCCTFRTRSNPTAALIGWLTYCGVLTNGRLISPAASVMFATYRGGQVTAELHGESSGWADVVQQWRIFAMVCAVVPPRLARRCLGLEGAAVAA